MIESAAQTTTSDDAGAVVAAALDYFERWFDGDEARMERALNALRELT